LNRPMDTAPSVPHRALPCLGLLAIIADQSPVENPDPDMLLFESNATLDRAILCTLAHALQGDQRRILSLILARQLSLSRFVVSTCATCSFYCNNI
jgi:hypothetical protein